MKKPLCLSLFVASCTLLAGRAALAQEVAGSGRGQPTGIGVGVAAMLRGPAGAQVAYNGGGWHVEGLLGASRNGNTQFGAAVRGWFHLHSTANADFSVGGGVGMQHFDNNNNTTNDDEDTMLNLEGGVQLRAFIVSNVALHAFVGIGVAAGDNDRDGFTLGGQFFSGGVGLTYYFF